MAPLRGKFEASLSCPTCLACGARSGFQGENLSDVSFLKVDNFNETRSLALIQITAGPVFPGLVRGQIVPHFLAFCEGNDFMSCACRAVLAELEA